MTEGIGIALIGGSLTLITAVIVPLLVSLTKRTRHVERQNRLGWLYIRSLIDHAYRYSDLTAHPLPQPPAGWLDDDL